MPSVIDLFCGAGGLSKGFEDAGYQILLGIDTDASALNTFLKNHVNTQVLEADLSDETTFDKIERMIPVHGIDVIIGGPPCQGFSLTGPRKFDDSRNRLYLALIETVRRLQPKAFVIENVPGMARLYDGEIKNEIIRRFELMGYRVNAKIVCAADYGVPQIRQRLIFVGLRGFLFEFPEPYLTEGEYVTCEQAISDLPSRENEIGKEIDQYVMPPQFEYQKIMRGDTDVLYNHVATRHTDLVKQVISMVPEGGNYKDLPDGVGTSRKFHVAWTRYHSKKPSKTIDTGHRNHFHYKYNRVPTIRENARLQSFPDDFVFLGTKTEQNRQVGNAVPPLLGRAIAKQLKFYIGMIGDKCNER